MNTNREQLSLDQLAFKRPIISGLGATRTLNGDESGSLVLLDRAAGIVITLPTYASVGKPGMFFEFYCTVTVTSNAYKIITGAGTELLTGGYLSIDTDTTNAMATFTPNGTTHVSVNMTPAGTNALGGMIGTKLRFTSLSATLWLVEGVNNSAGTPASAFST